MNTSRRKLLQGALGLGQVALLDRFGLLRPGRAHAASSDAPSRLVVLYVPGGWRPQYYFWPGTDAAVAANVPTEVSVFSSEPSLFGADRLMDLAPANGSYAPLRVFRSWDPAMPGRREGGFSPSMYGFVQWQLANDLSVVHGVDQGSADHASAYISAMSGAAGGDYRAPALHSIIANHLYASTRERRPLPFVAVTTERGTPQGYGLPSHAAPVRAPTVGALKALLSTKTADNPWWSGLEDRTSQAVTNWNGTPGGTLDTTVLEKFSLTQPARFRGRSTPNVDGFLEQLHGNLTGVSRLLAYDVVNVLSQTKGIEMLTTNRPAYLSSYLPESFTYTFGVANLHMTGLDPRFDMALRLMKADVTSAIHLSLGLDFDTHNGVGHQSSAAHGRNMMDLVARFLGEMKATPCPGKPGKTLLDDTLVLCLSEFGRSWATPNGTSHNLPDDHHPYTSVLFAGGNVAPNRMVGTYNTSGIGQPVAVTEEDGSSGHRVPRSADVVTTAMRIMGLGMHDFFIPGGYGEIVGLRANG